MPPELFHPIQGTLVDVPKFLVTYHEFEGAINIFWVNLHIFSLAVLDQRTKFQHISFLNSHQI